MTGLAVAHTEPSPRLLPASLLLLLLSGLLLLTGLGDYALLDRDESRYGQIPREMLEQGDWLTPRLYGKTYTDKPPMLYWQVMTSFLVFGRSEFAARLPVALAALALIQGVFWTAGRFAGTRSGFIAGLILTTMLLFFGLGRYLVLDGVLSAFTVIAAFLAFANLPRPPTESDPLPPAGAALLGRRSLLHSVVVWSLLGMAVLVKGPVALILFGMPFILLRIWQHGPAWLWSPRLWWRLMADVHLGLGLPILFLIAAPWFLMMERAHEGFLHEFFVNQNIKRYTTPDAFSRHQPFYFFLGIAVAGLFPWTPFLPGAVRRFLRGGWRNAAHARSLAAFALVLGLFPILFFSFSSSKLIPYIAPAFPGLALFLGLYFDDLLRNGSSSTPCLAARVLGVAALLIGLAPGLYFVQAVQAVLKLSNPLEIRILIFFSLPMLAMGGYLLFSGARLTTRGILAATSGGMFAFLGMAAISGLTDHLGAEVSHAAMMEQLAREEPHDPRPLLIFRENDEHASVYFYHAHWQVLVPVHQPERVHEELKEHRTVRLLLHRKDVTRVTNAIGPGYTVTPMRAVGNTLEWAVEARDSGGND